MKKYAISREFFPWNLFAPPISEKFLATKAPTTRVALEQRIAFMKRMI